MRVTLAPVAGNTTSVIHVNGMILTVNGEEIDLSEIPEGGDAAGEWPLIGRVTRDSVTIAYEFNSVKAESVQSTNKRDYVFDITEGQVPSPIKWREGVDDAQ